MGLNLSAVYQYAEDVLSGQILACKFVKQACQRFQSDLETAESRGLYFDELDAQYALDFFDITRHVAGPLRGLQIDLEPWQGFIVANIFGWKWRATGLRRFRTAYNEIGRKNAKSTLSSGVGIFTLAFDGEGGPQVFSAATTKSQAKIVFGDARRMALASPALRKRLTILKHEIEDEHLDGIFRALASDADNLDGLNPHCAIVDELHAHKTREVWDVLETAVGARLQPLLWAITTAGTNREGICYEIRQYVVKILSGEIIDDSTFGIIYTLDEGDEWADESNWSKSNPNLNVSVTIDDIRRLALKAAESPRSLANFLTKRLNVWCNSVSAWLNADEWNACPTLPDDEHLRTLPCWIGVDLSQKLDLTAVVRIFQGEDGSVYIVPRFYLPENAIHRKRGGIGGMYAAWAEQGYLILTPGDTVDYDVIERDLRDDAANYDVQAMAFDPYSATQLSQHLMQDGLPILHVPMYFRYLSEPMKTLEAMVVSGQLHHGNNPIMNWCAGNVVIKHRSDELLFPRKETQDDKIDGVVALVLGMSRMILGDSEISADAQYSGAGVPFV